MSAGKTARIPSLDGIRGISILSVVYGHLIGTRGFAQEESFDFGHIGLRAFFVVSGFLITTLLVEEHRKYGHVSLSRFYFRRTMRILPPFYVAIVGVVVGRALGWIDISRIDIVRAAMFLTNYFQERSWSLGHTWSLAVEEQFYLVWPATLVVLGLTRGLRAAVVFFFLGSFFRLGTYFVLGQQFVSGIGETFPTVADSMAAGCVLALARRRLEASSRYQALLRSWIVPAAFCLIFVVHSQAAHAMTYWAIGVPIENACIALCVHWAVTFPAGRVGRLLNWSPIVYVGTISYSLYLWQQMFLNRFSEGWLNAFPQNIVAALVVGATSYYVVEQPVLRLRMRLEARWLPRATIDRGPLGPLGPRDAA